MRRKSIGAGVSVVCALLVFAGFQNCGGPIAAKYRGLSSDGPANGGQEDVSRNSGEAATAALESGRAVRDAYPQAPSRSKKSNRLWKRSSKPLTS